jgi:hypothetical protein
MKDEMGGRNQSQDVRNMATNLRVLRECFSGPKDIY